MVDKELLEVLSNWKDELKSDMNSIRDELKSEMNSMRDELKGDMDSMYAELKGDINSINKRLQSLENICTVMQKEHGEKLDLLLDYASANIEKHEEYDKKMEHFDNKLFDHDVRLGIIEGSSWYKKMLKGNRNSSLSTTSLS